MKNTIYLICKDSLSEEYEINHDIIKRVNYENETPALKYFNTNYTYSLIDITMIDGVRRFKLLLKNNNTELIRTFIGKTLKDKIRLFLKFKGKELLVNVLAIIGGFKAIFDIILEIIKNNI